MVDWVDPSIFDHDYVPAVVKGPDVASPELACMDFWGRVVAENTYALGVLGTEILQTDAKGQSFTPDTDCFLSAFQFPVGIGSVAQALTLRIGTSADLSTYLAEYTASVIADDSGYATITTDRALQLTGGTKYYLGLIRATVDPFYIRVNLSDIYSDGEFLSTSSGWTMAEVSAYDLNFKVWGLTGK